MRLKPVLAALAAAAAFPAEAQPIPAEGMGCIVLEEGQGVWLQVAERDGPMPSFLQQLDYALEKRLPVRAIIITDLIDDPELEDLVASSIRDILLARSLAPPPFIRIPTASLCIIRE